MHSLADTVASSKTLKVLRLDENAVEPSGAAALAGALHKDSSLEELQISHASIGDEGQLSALQDTDPRNPAHFSCYHSKEVI